MTKQRTICTRTDINGALATLHPALRERAAEHVTAIEQDGFAVARIIAWESLEERARLWALGRKRLNGYWEITDQSQIVTYSQLGWHPFGLGFDLDITMGSRHLQTQAAWKRIGQLGVQCGLQWRGHSRSRWVSARHFQLVPTGLRPSRVLQLYRSIGSLEGLWDELSRRHEELR